MLWADRFALSAGDTGRRLATLGGCPAIVSFGTLQVAIGQVKIHTAESSWDIDFLWAAFHTILAACTRNGRHSCQSSLYIRNYFALCISKRLELFHIRNVILHLLYRRHTGENRHQSVQGSGEAYCPGGKRSLRGLGIKKTQP